MVELTAGVGLIRLMTSRAWLIVGPMMLRIGTGHMFRMSASKVTGVSVATL